MDQQSQKRLLDRLARIEGQVRAVRKMIEEDRACPDVLNQMLAARSGIEQAGRMVLDMYVDNCFARRPEVPQEALEEIRETLKIWGRYAAEV